MSETYTNFGTTTLTGDYNPGDGVLHVASVASFPSTGTFTVNCGDVLYTVTAIATGVLTVTLESNSDASHSTGAAVDEVISVRTLDQLKQDIQSTMPITLFDWSKPQGQPAYAVGKEVATTGGVATTVLNYSGGPGYVSDMWFALNSGGDDGTSINITVDGVTVYNGRYDLYFADTYFRGGWGPAPFWTEFVCDKGGQGTFIPIPFSTSITITVTTVGSAQLWWCISYHTGVPNTWKLTRKLKTAFVFQTELIQDQVCTLIDVSGLSPGKLLGVYTMVDSYHNGSGGANPATAPMEGRFKIYLDGTQAYESSGYEDYYRMAGYFGGVSAGANSSPYIAVPIKNVDHWGAVRFHIKDAYEFTNALKITWNCGESAIHSFSGTIFFTYMVWYYTE